MQRSRNGRSDPRRPRDGAAPTRARQRAYAIAALPEGDDLGELRELLKTAGVAVVGQAVQHRDRPHPNTYLGPGKLLEVK
ncbi:MAG: GTPase HflX, partial [Actinomycetota bacterium]|nr:GTPase HflX [Actinomycetota bacterium]